PASSPSSSAADSSSASTPGSRIRSARDSTGGTSAASASARAARAYSPARPGSPRTAPGAPPTRRTVTVMSTRPRATRPWTSRRSSGSWWVRPRGSFRLTSRNRWLSDRASTVRRVRAPRASPRPYPVMLTTRPMGAYDASEGGWGCQHATTERQSLLAWEADCALLGIARACCRRSTPTHEGQGHGERARPPDVRGPPDAVRLPVVPPASPLLDSPDEHDRDVPQGRAVVGLLDGRRPADLPVLPGRDGRAPAGARGPPPPALRFQRPAPAVRAAPGPPRVPAPRAAT